MKAREMMDDEFVYVSPEEKITDVSIRMEKYRKFTSPVLDSEMKLIGWITSLDVMRALREGKKSVKEVMYPPEETICVKEYDPARVAVLKASKYKVVSIPVLNDEGVVVGIIRSYNILKTLSHLYEIKVYKIFEAMESELKGVSWDELMEAAALVTKRETGERIKAKDYEERIKNSTFGEAIWATGGLEKFFVGLIAIGELVIARKVARARK
ncbi:CBS domain-containing protein [Methanobacterium aggregans]|uniref:CBS domain-containing protein n=1 Tax=Methanobacterium aggregans TaxID=1615586 RepID=UPI001AE924B1|nr:CBS domain-containing protein [Methanobacterium aggregans]MBP2045315.1 CBS domain-containing protein [Methanobacterium aggregans]